LVVIAGVVIVLAVIVLANSTLRRGNLKDQMEKYRQQVESDRRGSGLDLVQWPMLRRTTGSLRSGGDFDAGVVKMDQTHVDIVGFMVPLDQFRNMTDFLLLPVPIECYFCESPPARDVIYVKMQEGQTTNLFQEPVLINGIFNLHPGPKQDFFYTISDATLGPGVAGAKLSPKSVSPQHMIPGHQPTEDLLQGMEPPKPAEDTTK
jgi:hypothetical protein